MSDDFREGFIAGLDCVISMIQDDLRITKLTPVTAEPLQMLAEEIRMELAAVESGQQV
jgi:hypothetical protein